MARAEKRKGLHRPRKTISFQISNTESGNGSKQSSALRKQILMLDLIIRRGKNQHRSQLFFRQAQILRRSLRQLLSIHNQLEKLSVFPMHQSADEVRQRFEKEASLRGRREIVEEHIRENLVPKCYISFSTVVADLPFANLGVVLMALLAEIAAGKDGIGVPVQTDIPKEIRVEDQEVRGGDGRSRRESSEIDMSSLVGLSTKMTGADYGEIIERRYEHIHTRLEGHEQLSMNSEDNQGIDSKLDKAFDTTREAANTKHVATDHFNAKPEDLGVQKSHNKLVVKAKRAKKKKKKKSALDDLFSNLL